MQKRLIVSLLSALVVVLVIIFTVYGLTEKTVVDAPKNLQARDIETTTKMWLNGYLGSLFRFQYMGVINWLVLPLIFIYLFRQKIQNIPVPVLGISVFILLAFLLISWKGFFNYRYQFTLVPVLTFFVFLLVWNLLKDVDKKILYAVAICLMLMNTGNFLRYTPYKKIPQKAYAFIFHNARKKPVANQQNPDVFYVDNIYQKIDTMETESFFLVNNLPGFYYYTSKQGLYYWAGTDLIYKRTGPEPLFSNNSDELVSWQLSNLYNCHYILTAKSYAGYNQRFDAFINNNCKLVAQDELYQLYQIIRK